jgi:hypothetical protein
VVPQDALDVIASLRIRNILDPNIALYRFGGRPTRGGRCTL